MENNLNPYGNNDGNSEAYHEGQEWEFPLSDSLEDLDNLTIPQMRQAIGLRRPIPLHPSRPHPAAVNVEAIQEHTEVIGQTPELQIPVPQSERDGKGKGKAKGAGNFSGKRVSQRGKSFSKEEDKIICSAFLNVSKDPITGTNQSNGGYYQRIHKYFVENIEGTSTRSQIAICNRWLTIQKAVNKFCGHLSFVERLDRSGKTEQDRIDDAVKMYEESEPWTFMHCWNILRHEAKWSDKMVEINSGGRSTKVNQQVAGNNQGQQGQSDNDDNGQPARPEGRDSAKKHRSRGTADNDASSAAIEVLQSMNARSQIKDDKEDSQMAQILQRKDAKIELQQNMIALQREEMQKRWELEKEKLNLTREEVQLRKEQTKVEMMKAEAHFMGQDLDKLAPHLKEYYKSIQREIMERRGIISSPTSSSGPSMP
ncbi:hypothetical protein GQ55_2G257400 [Panicum hallii var. hallii]|uniref:No apical meristem-associated C-terminal domain-containing protein n=1 Tax=Panicum hallii var. hallii TaxID=1504633 RepID=A0A2T7ESD0_9POAL|nr:hypothetical protein GQ55_2G257400 [Panicum hallii var. hallii]